LDIGCFRRRYWGARLAGQSVRGRLGRGERLGARLDGLEILRSFFLRAEGFRFAFSNGFFFGFRPGMRLAGVFMVFAVEIAFRGGSLRFSFFLGFFVFCFSELLGERDGFLLAQIGVGDGVFASDLFGRRRFADIQRMRKRTGRFLPLSFRQDCRCDGFESVSGSGGVVRCAQVCA
jgi:hypothetical protein